MSSDKLKKLYLEFFQKKGHEIIANASLMPENDPTALFISAGMHPLVPYLLGQRHPSGRKLVNVQKCLRTSDIDEVGDSFHLSFFEMLGNWSLGDYFKEESIPWSYEFLTSEEWLNIDEEKLSVTVFAGDEKIPRDTESARIWEGLGIPKDRIFYLPREDNWWGPIGSTGPCGPDTEIFYDTGKESCGSECKPSCSCGKYNEIWNNVFMEYNRTPDGEYELLEQKNVDTGMGVERTVAVLQGKDNVYETEILAPLVNGIRDLSGIDVISEDQVRSVRIICDHSRAATFLLAEGIVPLNVEQGYVLRRVIRGAIRHGKLLGIEEEFLSLLSQIIIETYSEDYPHLKSNEDFIVTELKKEYKKFNNTLARGLNRFNRIARNEKKIDGKDAFLLYQSFGFPIEITRELGKENGIFVDVDGFYEESEKHQKVSRVGADKRFGSGLADTSEATVRLHTATHLLNEALRRVLGKDITQKGSNITQKRLRFDLNFDRKLTDREIRDVEDIVNRKINEALPVKRIETTLDEAIRMGSQAVFEQRYGEKASVYSIGGFSVELCSGPHVENTGELGRFKIIKEEGISAGVRRIRAVLE
ncbi:alanine--tRNA ligase [Candidatus Bathyarchaeota archaeon]|nr:alanine--tRNA ligase [Candidatus Bathyarchaeota archaeon]MBL7079783.1 alanine--tRNA ligase [Candidatus Bathyarchaeota archaeon]